jgi:cellulose 1,4-beta-cellobiosidase
VEPATTAPAPADVNPFVGADLYVDPEFATRVETTRAAHPEAARLLDSVQRSPTALWLDSIASLGGLSDTLDAVGAQAQRSGRRVLPVFVVYNLPNRDCSARSSNGELSIEAGGEQRYRTEFIDRIAQAFAAHPSQRVAVIVEPDSLPNLVTNLGHPKCALSQKVYASSVAYAIAQLSLPNVFLYLDSAHAAWLGWDAHRARMVDVVKEVLLMAGGLDRIRGFATNVSNYTSLAGDEGQRLERSNPCPNELSYVAKLSETLEAKGLTGKGFIIDTSRNGQSGMRTRWGNWCNIAGAGLGERPRAAPRPHVDAYYWVKPPGASDGTADPSSARFDANCASADATPGAPEAGRWFEPYLLGLAQRANPPL